MPNYILKYTEGAGLLFHHIGDHFAGNAYSVPGLTGCMGLICVPGPASTIGKFFLAHSKSDPHVDLKSKFDSYIRTNGISGHGTVIRAIWSVEAGQRGWIEARLPGVSLEKLGSSGPLYWPAAAQPPAGPIVGQESGDPDDVKTFRLRFNGLGAAQKKVRYAEFNQCQCCGSNFGLTLWKYRCKECNGIICSNCSEDGSPSRVMRIRVCSGCYTKKGPNSKRW